MSADQGTVTGFVIGMTASLVALMGLVHDGGRLVTAHLRAGDHAAGAARRAAQELTGLRSGSETWSVVDARRSAAQYLQAQGAAGEVLFTPTAVSVTVSTVVRFEILPLVGLTSRQVQATRSAVVVRR